ncbi:unnamed protein product [Sphagnum balticum]
MTMRCELSLNCMPLDLGLMDELAEMDAKLGREGFRPLQSSAVRLQQHYRTFPGAGVGLRPCLWCVRSHVFRAYMTTPEFGGKAEQRRADSSGGGGR